MRLAIVVRPGCTYRTRFRSWKRGGLADMEVSFSLPFLGVERTYLCFFGNFCSLYVCLRFVFFFFFPKILPLFFFSGGGEGRPPFFFLAAVDIEIFPTCSVFCEGAVIRSGARSQSPCPTMQIPDKTDQELLDDPCSGRHTRHTLTHAPHNMRVHTIEYTQQHTRSLNYTPLLGSYVQLIKVWMMMMMEYPSHLPYSARS